MRARIATVTMTIVRFEPDWAIAPPLAAAQCLLTGLDPSLAGLQNRCEMCAARMLVYTPRHTYRMSLSEHGAISRVQSPEPEAEIGPCAGERGLPDSIAFSITNFYTVLPVSHSFRELPACGPRCNYWKVIKEQSSSTAHRPPGAAPRVGETQRTWPRPASPLCAGCLEVKAYGVEHDGHSCANNGIGFFVAHNPSRNGGHHCEHHGR